MEESLNAQLDRVHTSREPSGNSDNSVSQAQQPQPHLPAVQHQPGTVSFSRLSQLEDINVDLTPVLSVSRRKHEEEARRKQEQQAQLEGEQQQRVAVSLPRNDARRLERSSRASKSMATTVVSSKPEDEEYKVGGWQLAANCGCCASSSTQWRYCGLFTATDK
jgi:hypothetical protein